MAGGHIKKNIVIESNNNDINAVSFFFLDLNQVKTKAQPSTTTYR